jgi:hypothetical protein
LFGGCSQTCIPNPNAEVEKPDCMYELFMQLMILFLGKQFIMEAVEQLVPKLKGRVHDTLLHKNTPQIEPPPPPPTEAADSSDVEMEENNQWYWRQFNMPRFGDKDIGGCLDDFNEIMIQFGFMTLFAVAFPGLSYSLKNKPERFRSADVMHDVIYVICVIYRRLMQCCQCCGSKHSAGCCFSCCIDWNVNVCAGGAFFALLNNIYEMRSDGDALLNDYQVSLQQSRRRRRPFPCEYSIRRCERTLIYQA